MEPFDCSYEAVELEIYLKDWGKKNQGVFGKGMVMVVSPEMCQQFVEIVKTGIDVLTKELEAVTDLDAHKRAAIWGIVCRKMGRCIFLKEDGKALGTDDRKHFTSYLCVDLMNRALFELDRMALQANHTRRKDLKFVFSAKEPTALSLSMIGYYLEREFPKSRSAI